MRKNRRTIALLRGGLGAFRLTFTGLRLQEVS